MPRRRPLPRRHRSFQQRINELEFHLANVRQHGGRPLHDRLIVLRTYCEGVEDQLAGLRAADAAGWEQKKGEVDLRLGQISGEIEAVGEAMHALVCTLHEHPAPQPESTLLAAR